MLSPIETLEKEKLYALSIINRYNLHPKRRGKMDKKLIIEKEIRRLLSDFKYNVETRCCEDFTTGRKDLRILDTWLFTKELTYLESALNSLFQSDTLIKEEEKQKEGQDV